MDALQVSPPPSSRQTPMKTPERGTPTASPPPGLRMSPSSLGGSMLRRSSCDTDVTPAANAAKLGTSPGNSDDRRSLCVGRLESIPSLGHWADNAPYNIAFCPQTWANPNKAPCPALIQSLGGVAATSGSVKGLKGWQYDGKPIEVVEIGAEASRKVGEAYMVKPLGAFLVGKEDGSHEVAWKVIGIAADDPMAPRLTSLACLQTELPGLLELIRHWLRTCMVLHSGDKPQSILLDHQPVDAAQAMRTIEELHTFWQLNSAPKTLSSKSMPFSRSSALGTLLAPLPLPLSRMASNSDYRNSSGVLSENGAEMLPEKITEKISMELPENFMEPPENIPEPLLPESHDIPRSGHHSSRVSPDVFVFPPPVLQAGVDSNHGSPKPVRPSPTRTNSLPFVNPRSLSDIFLHFGEQESHSRFGYLKPLKPIKEFAKSSPHVPHHGKKTHHGLHFPHLPHMPRLPHFNFHLHHSDSGSHHSDEGSHHAHKGSNHSHKGSHHHSDTDLHHSHKESHNDDEGLNHSHHSHKGLHHLHMPHLPHFNLHDMLHPSHHSEKGSHLSDTASQHSDDGSHLSHQGLHLPHLPHFNLHDLLHHSHHSEKGSHFSDTASQHSDDGSHHSHKHHLHLPHFSLHDMLHPHHHDNGSHQSDTASQHSQDGSHHSHKHHLHLPHFSMHDLLHPHHHDKGSHQSDTASQHSQDGSHHSHKHHLHLPHFSMHDLLHPHHHDKGSHQSDTASQHSQDGSHHSHKHHLHLPHFSFHDMLHPHHSHKDSPQSNTGSHVSLKDSHHSHVEPYHLDKDSHNAHKDAHHSHKGSHHSDKGSHHSLHLPHMHLPHFNLHDLMHHEKGSHHSDKAHSSREPHLSKGKHH
eukprot:TRINITY_DN53_c0_g1_i2.p1 TRINITY_DN53_c0_g1~~TRINITY_DN53_c0_g1_i2.p1  ORF type:complete len:996 (+),score=48.82 TRINITY_DN53_c0_g1_i2:410-2989(+)